MKNSILIYAFLFFTVTTYAQIKIDTFYFDKNYLKVPKQQAGKISIYTQKDSFLTVEEYNSQMVLRSRNEYRLRNLGKKNEYRVGNGAFENYNDDGSLKAKGTLVENEFDGNLVSYYPNERPVRQDVYKNGELIKGRCLDSMGNEIKFFPYQITPEFKGGVQEMFKYLGENIKYPRTARENGVEGTVYVGFVVAEDGSVEDVMVKRGVSKDVNDEALRVVKSMPKWEAGKLDNELVRVAYTLPIKFKLEGGTDGLLDKLFRKKKKNVEEE
jgi:TonB family protein